MEGARACMPWSGRAEEPRLSSALRQALGPGLRRSQGGGGRLRLAGQIFGRAGLMRGRRTDRDGRHAAGHGGNEGRNM